MTFKIARFTDAPCTNDARTHERQIHRDRVETLCQTASFTERKVSQKNVYLNHIHLIILGAK
jgi:hypothetical protein